MSCSPSWLPPKGDHGRQSHPGHGPRPPSYLHRSTFGGPDPLQVSGALLSIVFFLVLLQLSGARSTLAGSATVTGCALLLSVVVIEAALLEAVPVAAANGDQATVVNFLYPDGCIGNIDIVAVLLAWVRAVDPACGGSDKPVRPRCRRGYPRRPASPHSSGFQRNGYRRCLSLKAVTRSAVQGCLRRIAGRAWRAGHQSRATGATPARSRWPQ